jgi:hypothetical protein
MVAYPVRTPMAIEMSRAGGADYEQQIIEWAECREYVFGRALIRFEEIRALLQEHGYRHFGNHGVAEALKAAGWHKVDQGKRRGKTPTPRFWAPPGELVNPTPGEIFDYYHRFRD